RREDRLLSGPIEYGHVAPVVAKGRMVEEGNGVASRGDARPIHPTRRLVKRLAGRVFHAVTPLRRTNDDDGAAVRRPARARDVLEEIPRGAPREGRLRERAGRGIARREAQRVQDEHLARARDRLELDARERQAQRFEAVYADGVELGLAGAVPG